MVWPPWAASWFSFALRLFFVWRYPYAFKHLFSKIFPLPEQVRFIVYPYLPFDATAGAPNGRETARKATSGRYCQVLVSLKTAPASVTHRLAISWGG